MNKLIHCSDLHIDSKLVGLSSDKMRIRNQEIINCFKYLCNYAVSNNVDAVLICGDVFDTTSPSPQAVRAVAQIINSCASVKFVILAGNHDGINQQLISLVDSNQVFFIKDSARDIEIDNIRICGINLIKGNEQTQINSLRYDKQYRSSILMLHTDLDVSNSVYPNVNRNWFINCPFNYYALGHIHQYGVKELNDKIFCYSGCLAGRGFDEAGDKGFIEIQINNNNQLSYKFIPIESRKYYSETVDISKALTYNDIDAIIDVATTGISSDSIVRVELTGITDPQLIIDEAYITNKYNNQFFAVKLVNNTRIKSSTEGGQTLKSEFLNLMATSDCDEIIAQTLRSNKLSVEINDNLKQLIIDYTLKALSGVLK